MMATLSFKPMLLYLACLLALSSLPSPHGRQYQYLVSFFQHGFHPIEEGNVLPIDH
jgi:hypothetical protein